MGGHQKELQSIRQRLSHLLTTHLHQLAASPWIAKQGQVVIAQGASADSVLLVQSGELGVESLDRYGHSTLVATAGSGELLGEMGLFGDCKHSAQVTVISSTASLLRLDSDALLQAIMFDAELALEILALNSRRCLLGNQHLSLTLTALKALQSGNKDLLLACCSELRQGPTSLKEAEKQLMDIYSKIDRQT